MKKCLSLLLAICLLLCSAITVSAQDAPDTGPDDGVVISPLSGFIDGDNVFYTYVRLYVQNEDGNAVSGAVYGLYNEYGNLVEQLTTNSSGMAESGQISVDYDYYLEEISTPDGYLPNEGRYDIVLTDLCAPSRVDVYAEYEYIRGYLEVVKTDENGDPLGDCGFEVYRYDKRDIQLNFRVSADERHTIEQRMAMLQTTNMAAYIRKMAVEGYIVHLDTTDIRELVSQMRRYNNNLNQIAKRINETRHIYKTDMDEIRQQQDTIWSMVYKLVDNLTGVR